MPMRQIQATKNVRKVLFLPFFLVFFAVTILTGCGEILSDDSFEQATVNIKEAEGALGTLRKVLETLQVDKKAENQTGAAADLPPKIELDRNNAALLLPNIKYLRQYAAYIKKTQPDMEELVSTLEKEATVEGARFFYLKFRYDWTRRMYPEEARNSRSIAIKVASEAAAVTLGSQTDVFSDGLVDVINVLADMSKGKLPKLAFAETSDKEMPPTQHLVGNPAYGRWTQNSSGASFWVWYGQYSMFRNIVGWNSGYRYNQDYWYRSRSASYYGDVGRHYYGTNASNDSWHKIAKNNPNVPANRAQASRIKNFNSTKRLSSYAPRTRSAPKSMPKTGRASTYSNTRSSPSRSSGFGSRSSGK